MNGGTSSEDASPRQNMCCSFPTIFHSTRSDCLPGGFLYILSLLHDHLHRAYVQKQNITKIPMDIAPTHCPTKEHPRFRTPRLRSFCLLGLRTRSTHAWRQYWNGRKCSSNHFRDLFLLAQIRFVLSWLKEDDEDQVCHYIDV